MLSFFFDKTIKIKAPFLRNTITFFEFEMILISSFFSSVLLNIVNLVIIALIVAKIVEFSTFSHIISKFFHLFKLIFKSFIFYIN